MKLIATIAMLLILALAVPNVIAQNNPQPNVISPDSVAYGRTYSEWSAAWWQWAFSIPVASHPLFDNGDCSVGQSGPVWFLGGKFCQTGTSCSPGPETRSCSIPAGKALFFPLINVEDSAPEEPTYACGSMPPLIPGTIAEMRMCDESWVEFYLNGARNLKVEVDGKAVQNLRKDFRVRSVQFDATLPDDNLLKGIGESIAAGTYSPVVDDGIYVLLAPLSVGSHTLHFQGTFAGGWKENVTYNLAITK